MPCEIWRQIYNRWNFTDQTWSEIFMSVALFVLINSAMPAIQPHSIEAECFCPRTFKSSWFTENYRCSEIFFRNLNLNEKLSGNSQFSNVNQNANSGNAGNSSRSSSTSEKKFKTQECLVAQQNLIKFHEAQRIFLHAVISVKLEKIAFVLLPTSSYQF